ncbi:hypothetical protein TCAL_11938 [Tigriopus californicus]|uniref:Uncharacterized protein n=1 Tax=Tigriopus californicus TaxID=6832 RepID=A0A553P3Q1_TIGCA|nr:uncharacterized protein LOC131883100 [Tigriopus californicus]TRY72262.1 hypothetical protein TCAL_11938 [Tigriopus californicus]|eukprot:TCALIF_11938-PA protein Name:"Protein of unknown function" AED:0.00 eAED:0.00 QI:142/1/1/1/0/0.33/3/14/356
MSQSTMQSQPVPSQAVVLTRRSPNQSQHCSICRQIFRQKLEKHVQSGACERYFCRVDNHEHQRVDQTFETLAAAKLWIVQEQLDKTLVIVSSSGETIAYRCRFYSKPSSKADPMRNDPEKGSLKKKTASFPVPDLGCRAVIRVDRVRVCQCSPEAVSQGTICQNSDSLIRLRGCLSHSHPTENQFLRMSKVCQDYLVSLLKLGMDKRSILRVYFQSGLAQEQDLKCITTQDLRNLERKFIKKKTTSQNSTKVEDEVDLNASNICGQARNDAKKEFQRRAQAQIDELRAHLFDSSVAYQSRISLLEKLEVLNSETRLEKSVFAQDKRHVERDREECRGRLLTLNQDEPILTKKIKMS